MGLKTVEFKTAIPKAEIAAFCRRWQIREFALFGSILDETFGRESDVDVLVAFAPDVKYSFRHLIEMQDELEAIFGRAVDLIEKQALEESPNFIRRQSILNSAQIIYAE